MLDLGIEKIGELGIVECRGRIVRSPAALKLLGAVASLGDSRVIVLDLSEVRAIEGGGIGVLQFLHRWTLDHGIQFKLFNPTKSVFDMLESAHSSPPLRIASLQEMMLLIPTPELNGPVMNCALA